MEKNTKFYSRPKPNKRDFKRGFCQDCKIKLNDKNWNIGLKNYHRHICKACWKTRQAGYTKNAIIKNPNYYKNRRDVQKKKEAGWPEERKALERLKRYDHWLFRKYGMTLSDYIMLLKKQKLGCAICQKKTAGGKGVFHVDHCHNTKKVRGLLCFDCNLLLGHARDSIKTLKSAITYVNSNKKRK